MKEVYGLEPGGTDRAAAATLESHVPGAAKNNASRNIAARHVA
jgi:hypothetical protein